MGGYQLSCYKCYKTIKGLIHCLRTNFDDTHSAIYIFQRICARCVSKMQCCPPPPLWPHSSSPQENRMSLKVKTQFWPPSVSCHHCPGNCSVGGDQQPAASQEPPSAWSSHHHQSCQWTFANCTMSGEGYYYFSFYLLVLSELRIYAN